MRRIFIFTIPSLNYLKSDLNIVYSENRKYIGQIARMITNAIFLSHSLREKVIIRILVKEPTPHLFEIKSESIRYLGPELRSSASILRKAEKYLLEKSKNKSDDIDNWFQPNPGLFVRITDNILIDLENELENSHILLFKSQDSKDLSNQPEKSQLFVLENLIRINNLNKDSFLFIIPLYEQFINDFIPELVNYENNATVLPIENRLSYPNLVSIINLIIDKIEEKN